MASNVWLRIVVTGLVAWLGLPPGAARAQNEEAVVQKMVDLNKRALTDLEGKSFEAAKDALLEAVVVGKEAGLGNHKMMARTYLHLGAVYVDGLKDRSKAVRYLVLALKIRSDIQPTPSLATPAMTAAFEEARRDLASAPPPAAEPKPVAAPTAPAPPPPAPSPAPPPRPERPKKAKPSGPEEPDLPATIPTPLHCPNPDEAPPKSPIALRCVAQPGVAISRVLLFYRVPGGEKFTAVPTVKSPKGWFNGAIPTSATSGKSLHFYLEARDASDAVVGNSGRVDSPNLMFIREGAPVVGKGALAVLRFQKKGGAEVSVDDENPLEAFERQKEEAKLDAVDQRRRSNSLFLGLAIGSGYGWHPKSKLEFRQDLKVGAGAKLSGLMHFAVELGYQWNAAWSSSLQLRQQYIPAEGAGDTAHPGNPASGAFMVLLKLTRWLGDGNAQLGVSGMLGGGDGFRLVVPARPDRDATKSLPRTDTVKGGPFVAGPGVTGVYHLSRRFAALVEVKALFGPTPDAVVDDETNETKTGLAYVLDFAAGVQVAF